MSALDILRPRYQICAVVLFLGSLAANAGAAPMSCSAEIGKPAASRLADMCRTLSPATHPPCNAANSCAMIQEEIARSCAMLPAGGGTTAGCRARGDPAAAVDVIRLYYRAIAERDYAVAYRQWGHGGADSGKSLEGFARGFARTRSSAIIVGKPEEPEGAAGSTFITVPVRVNATLVDGTRQHFRGSYTLRRVNDVPGATEAQLRWHISAGKLRPVR